MRRWCYCRAGLDRVPASAARAGAEAGPDAFLRHQSCSAGPRLLRGMRQHDVCRHFLRLRMLAAEQDCHPARRSGSDRRGRADRSGAHDGRATRRSVAWHPPASPVGDRLVSGRRVRRPRACRHDRPADGGRTRHRGPLRRDVVRSGAFLFREVTIRVINHFAAQSSGRRFVAWRAGTYQGDGGDQREHRRRHDVSHRIQRRQAEQQIPEIPRRADRSSPTRSAGPGSSGRRSGAGRVRPRGGGRRRAPCGCRSRACAGSRCRPSLRRDRSRPGRGPRPRKCPGRGCTSRASRVSSTECPPLSPRCRPSPARPSGARPTGSGRRARPCRRTFARCSTAPSGNNGGGRKAPSMGICR